jgi:hypothetical protein
VVFPGARSSPAKAEGWVYRVLGQGGEGAGELP